MDCEKNMNSLIFHVVIPQQEKIIELCQKKRYVNQLPKRRRKVK